MLRRIVLVLPALALTVGAIAWAAQSPSDAARVVSEPPPEEQFDRIMHTDDGQTFASRVEGRVTRIEQLAPVPKLITLLDEPLHLRLADPAGKRLVLANPIAPDADAYNPGPRAETHLVVLNVATKRAKAYDFARNLEPEAFGVGNSALFVIDHRPATNPTYYRVSMIDLSDGSDGGAFHELFGPDKQPLEDMTGTARYSVPSKNGEQLYTLYVQHKHTAAHEGMDPNALPVAAFIHVLDLRFAWAACIDLPGFGHGPVEASTIELSADGSEIVVTDTYAKQRAVVRTADVSISAMRAHPPAVRIDKLDDPAA
jgi:hypothetical protein